MRIDYLRAPRLRSGPMEVAAGAYPTYGLRPTDIWPPALPVPHQVVRPRLAHVGEAAERHGDVELPADALQGLGDAGLAHGAQAVDVGAADEDAPGAQRQRLQHILAAADAAVHQDLDALAHGGGDRRQCGDRRDGAVELPA